ncbi:hypothetical protein T484DRAFT_3101338 [Baffinella frigidus]|nr:hypothetical protein T484DRAFT_3101338 [Cryptophyta sp. CCMP2293]
MPDEELQLDGASGSFVVDGGLSCISGAYVKVSDDFLSWDAFRKYDGKVGRLSWRHFSGMWYAEFPDEEEYGFLCGPLLFQLIYSSAEEADAAAIAMAEKERKRLENENTKEAKGRRLAKEQVKLQSENADKVRKLFASLAVLQNGLLEAHHDTKVSYAAHQDLTVTCTRMQATIDTQEGKLAEAKKQKEQIMLQLETVRKARADAEARCADQVQKLLVMERRLSDSEGLGLMKDEEIRILKKARLENTQEIARLKTENQAQEETISRLSAQKKELTDELLAAGQRELRLTAQVAQLTSAMEEMQEAHELMVKQQREDLDAGREARDAAQSELDEALRQNKDMSEELEGAREAVIRLDAIEAKEEGRVEEKLITVSEAEKMRAELEAKLNEEIRFLKNQLDGLQDTVTEIADLKKELLESKQNNEKLQDVNKKRGADYQRCQEELRKERGLKNDLQTKLLCTEQDLALKTKEFNDMTTERDGLVVIRVELSLKLAHLREEEKKLQERYQSEIRLREEAQNQLVDTREKLAEADRQMRQAQESAKVNAKAKAVADKAGRESFNKMLESKQLLVTTREELQTAKADNAQLFNKTNQRILDLQAELGGIIALRQQFEDFREVAKQDQIMADEKLSTRQAKQDALQAQLAETESDLRHEGALSKHVQKRLDGQLTFDIPVAVAFFPWRLFVVAQQSRDVEKKRQLMLADIRRRQSWRSRSSTTSGNQYPPPRLPRQIRPCMPRLRRLRISGSAPPRRMLILRSPCPGVRVRQACRTCSQPSSTQRSTAGHRRMLWIRGNLRHRGGGASRRLIWPRRQSLLWSMRKRRRCVPRAVPPVHFHFETKQNQVRIVGLSTLKITVNMLFILGIKSRR